MLAVTEKGVSMTDNNVRLQNLRDFTVQIRDVETDAIVGTGIAVSMEGQIVTCAHVVEALGIDPRNATDAEIGVYFQFAAGGEKKDRRAIVNRFFQQNDEDIVLLQLTEGPAPLAPEQLPKLGNANQSAGHAFKSFGYRRLSSYQGLPANGEIIDYAAKPENKNLLCDPVMLTSQHIDSGMSGAAVLDVERNLVVGIVFETYESAWREKDRDTGFAIDNHVLTFSPFDFVLEDEPYPLQPAPQLRVDVAQATIKEKFYWHAAPAILDEFTGRDAFLAEITADWNDPKKHITGLIGFGGEGKSSLARKWVDTLISPLLKGEGPGVRSKRLSPASSPTASCATTPPPKPTPPTPSSATIIWRCSLKASLKKKKPTTRSKITTSPSQATRPNTPASKTCAR